MATKNIDVKINVDSNPVKSLKQELRETVQQLQNMESGTKEFEKMTIKAAELKDKIADTNEQIAVFASGSKYEQASNGLGQVGDALRNLDFGKAQERAASFATVAKSISFGDAIKSVKDLGSTFLTVGKALLTNPLFLIAAVVTLIVVGIVKLLDKLGILKKIFDAVGKAVDYVVQALKDFLDWIGLTTFAAEDAAERQSKAQEKVAKAYEDKRNKLVTAYDQEIALAQIAGESTFKLERNKQQAIIETSRQQYKALEAQRDAAKAAGILTAEQSKAINESMTALRLGIEGASRQIELINAKEVQDNKKKNTDIEKANQDSYKKRIEDLKKYEADRLAAQRLIQDLELELMEEGVVKDLEANKIKYARLIADTISNEKLLAAEKDRVIFDLRQISLKNELDIERKFQEEQALLAQQITDARIAEEERKKNAVIAATEQMAAATQEAAQKEIEAAKEAAAVKQQIQEQYTGSVIALTETVFAITNGLGKQDEASKEARAKRQFQVQKALNLSLAIIDGVKAVQASIAQSPIAIGPIPNPAGIASLAFAVATSVANVAKIASAKYGGGGSGASKPSIPATAPQPQAQTQGASFNLFGQANQGNNASSSQSVEKPMTIIAKVSAVDMTAEQASNQKNMEMATL
jgi:hypothetical protein